MKEVLIIGYGEIGKSVGSIEKEAGNKIYTVDLNGECELKEFDVIHISFPYDEKFIRSVKEYLTTYSADIVIVHSTVDIGTIKTIYDATKIDVVHSPVIGVHPHLAEGIKTFKKYVGGEEIAVRKAKEHLESLGIKCLVFDSSNDTEAAKLLDTTYYGWNILYMKEVEKFCRENNLNFEQVYTLANENYNNGYEKLGMGNVRRPNLKPMAGKIGGHCVVPNFRILKDKFKPAKIGDEINNTL